MIMRKTKVSASATRRNASCDMNYIYMCNRNSASQNDVTKRFSMTTSLIEVSAFVKQREDSSHA